MIFLRIVFLAMSAILVPVFLTALTLETGGSSIYPLIIPVLGSIALIVFLSRQGKELWLKFLPFVLLLLSFAFSQGSFMNYTLVGLALFMALFNALRPWNV